MKLGIDENLLAATTARASDREFEEVKIRSVRSDGDGWSIQREDGWSFFVPPNPLEPQPGMKATFYGKGIGYTVRGLLLDDQVVFYRSPEEQREYEKSQEVKRVVDHHREFEERRAEYDARFDALPKVFQDRLQRFRDHCVEFRWEFEPYELIVCEVGAAIAKSVPASEIRDFAGLDWSEQTLRVPEIDGKGLSSNQFGCAVRLAHWFHTKPENVVLEHAAIAVITGCEKCGCYHPSDAQA